MQHILLLSIFIVAWNFLLAWNLASKKKRDSGSLEVFWLTFGWDFLNSPCPILFSLFPLSFLPGLCPSLPPQEERHEISSSIIQRNMSFSFSFSFLNNIFPFSNLAYMYLMWLWLQYPDK